MTIHKANGTTETLTDKAAFRFGRKLTMAYFEYRRYSNGWQILYPNTGYVPFLLKTSETEYREFFNLHALELFVRDAFRKVA